MNSDCKVFKNNDEGSFLFIWASVLLDIRYNKNITELEALHGVNCFIDAVAGMQNAPQSLNPISNLLIIKVLNGIEFK